MQTKYSYWCFRDVLSQQEINKIKRIAVKSGYSSSTTRGHELSLNEPNLNVRDTDVSFSNDEWLYDILCPFLYGANESAGWNYDIDWCEDVQIARYKKNQHYGWHPDGGSDIHGAYDENDNGKRRVRKLSLVAILSDKHVGGELEFSIQSTFDPNTVLNEILKPKLNLGDVVVFPSYVFHRSTPIEKGTKYSVTMWCLGSPFK